MINSSQGFSEILLQHFFLGSLARLLMVQFTNNDGMCNDPFYVNVNLAQTTHRGLRPLLFTNSVWVR